jgi:hypothetical protein
VSLGWRRLWTVITTVMVLLFTTTILLLQTLPYTPHTLLNLFTASDDCLQICFLGIQPGVTDVNTAIRLLESRGWMGHVEAAGFESGIEFFTWNGQHPDVMSQWEWASLGAENEVVRTLVVPTRIRLGDLIAYYGMMGNWLIRDGEAFAVFERQGFAVFFPLPESVRRSTHRLLWAHVTLYFRKPEVQP